MALDKVKDDMLQDNLVFPGSTTQFPSLTTTQRNALSSVQPGTVIYNSTVGKLQQYDGNNQWASIDSPPVITSLTYPTESGEVLTALDATGSTDAAQTLIINGSNFSSTSDITVQIEVSGSYVAFASSLSVNNARTQITCTGVTKRAAADNYTLKVTNVTGLSATSTVNFSADPSFSTAASLGTVETGQTLSKSIAFTGTKVIQGATTKPTWMTVTGNTSTADNGASDTTFDATGSPITLGGTAANSGTTQNFTFSIIVKDAENQTFNRDFTLTVTDPSTGGINGSGNTGFYTTYTAGGQFYRTHKFQNGDSNTTLVLQGNAYMDILIIGGGGGGGTYHGGGGGAGEMIEISGYRAVAGTYTMSVGAGGAAQSSSYQYGNSGGDSTVTGPGSAFVWTANGGGGGAWHTGNANRHGAAGGSGGGGGLPSSSQDSNGGASVKEGPTSITHAWGTADSSGITINRYGNAGGAVYNSGPSGIADGQEGGGGGGGAGAAGLRVGTANVANSNAGSGGAGRINTWLDNTADPYAAGGGGGQHQNAGGTGGAAGGTVIGGHGEYQSGTNAPTAGTAHTGSGGGGGKNSSQNANGNGAGGSGVIIVRTYFV